MIWLLPLIVIGGFLYPLLGYLVLAMMVFLLILSFFKGRYWCWNLCPRGAFLDIVLSKVSAKKPLPTLVTKQWFRWLLVALFMSFLMLRIVRTGGNYLAIGLVFVVMCALTTVISIVIGVITKHRGWCMICPMGTLQERIHKIRK
jgi:ferredoxin-type protein NapH